MTDSDYKEWEAETARRRGEALTQEFAEAVARGEYAQCVPLEQVRAIYQDGFAAGQARMRERAVDALPNVPRLGQARKAIAALPLEDAPEVQP